jgi:hypothetical protein
MKPYANPKGKQKFFAFWGDKTPKWAKKLFKKSARIKKHQIISEYIQTEQQ